MDQAKLEKIKQLIDKAGIHPTVNDAYSLARFFDIIVEECAQAAESRRFSFSGDGSEALGVLGAAAAVRDYGRRPQGAGERKYVIGPGR